jgi:hypothetical protein
MERLRWTDRVRNEMLHGVEDEWGSRRKRGRRKANWCINCLPRHVIEGKIEWRITKVTGRRVRGRKLLLTRLKETIEYWKLKETP